MTKICAVDRKTGKYVKFTDRNWESVGAMTELDGKLYVVEGGALYEVDTTGKVTKLNTWSWSGVQGMTGVSGKLYVFSSDPKPEPHAIDKTGKDTPVPLPTGWVDGSSINGIAALRNKLYLIMPNMGSTITLFTLETK